MALIPHVESKDRLSSGKIESVILKCGSKVRDPSRLSEACALLLATLETCAPLAALEAHTLFTILEACAPLIEPKAYASLAA
ncbi:hypothetical protein Tco_0854901 [Tanacetum coccineum]